jgi:L-ascorbate metabolism protein UlaG (beta-lactamase superfamily)
MADLKGASVTWLGHSTVLVTTPKGTNVLIDPFIENNPKFPKDFKLPEKIDLVLVTHGHFDHISDAAPVAKKHGSTVVGTFELVAWLQSKGVANVVGMNIGGSYKHNDVTMTQTEARHTSGIQDGDKFIYGGVPTGFVLAIENGPVLYHAGDTGVFSDMQLIRELHSPELGMLPIGDHFTMGPKAAALAAKYLGVKQVLPIHFGTMPQLTGTPEELEKHLSGTGAEVLKVQPGQAVR